MRPFEQLPFAELPELPRRPHGWLDLPVQRVTTESEGLGTVDWAYRRVGQGPPLLLVHGLMTTGYSFRYLVDRLKDRRTLIVPDLPGAGDTVASGRMGPEAVADALAAFQEAVGIEGCDVVGNSMGGYLCLWLVLRHPRSVGRLVDLHGPAFPEARLWALQAVIRLPGAQAILGALVRRDPRRWAHKNVHYWDESLKSLEEAAVYGDVLATSRGLGGFVAQLRDMMDPRGLVRLQRALRDRRGRLPVPVQLVYARHDPMVSPAVGAQLAEQLDGVELVWLEEGSHFAHVDATDAFVASVAEFLGL